MAAVKNYIKGMLFEYETQKVVAVTSYKIGIIYRTIQLSIVAYVIAYIMIKEKGYQSFGELIGGITTKVKGLEFTDLPEIPSIGRRVWDVADWSIPPAMNSAFFVTVNAVITKDQAQGNCEEDIDNWWHSKCKVDSDCKKGHLDSLGWGRKTGKCVRSTRGFNKSICEIHAWCPTERDGLPLGKGAILMPNVANFTVLIKNSIEFPKFNVQRRNILESMDKKFLQSCVYNKDDPVLKYCPIFRLGDIIKYGNAHNPGANTTSVWITGGMVSIDIRWDCDLDYDEEKCLPEYRFRHLNDGKVGKGWNFRTSFQYMEGNVTKRILMKLYGIQFFVTVSGRAGKFDIINFSMNLGSGLALLTLATVFCDIILLNFLSKSKKYNQAKVDKVQNMEEEDLRELINKVIASKQQKSGGSNNGTTKDKDKNKDKDSHSPQMEELLSKLPDIMDIEAEVEFSTQSHQKVKV